jgi:hypothetical protein
MVSILAEHHKKRNSSPTVAVNAKKRAVILLLMLKSWTVSLNINLPMPTITVMVFQGLGSMCVMTGRWKQRLLVGFRVSDEIQKVYLWFSHLL